jgi:hypothetical protein
MVRNLFSIFLTCLGYQIPHQPTYFIQFVAMLTFKVNFVMSSKTERKNINIPNS